MITRSCECNCLSALRALGSRSNKKLEPTTQSTDNALFYKLSWLARPAQSSGRGSFTISRSEELAPSRW